MRAAALGAIAVSLVASGGLALKSASQSGPAVDGRAMDGVWLSPVSVSAPAPDPDPFADWTRPPGPVRIALQAGHWRASEAPPEQAGLRDNGARVKGIAEWEVNLEIARRTAALRRDSGYTVDILPTTIPPGYWADLFIAIHADGHNSSRISGYRAAAPRRDRTGQAATFASLLDRIYGEETGLDYYGSVTRRMRGYYAFNSRRYQHALHPMTVGVILETGFLTSPRDRKVLVEAPDRAARGIARAVMEFVSPIPPVPSPTVTRSLNVGLQSLDSTRYAHETR